MMPYFKIFLNIRNLCKTRILLQFRASGCRQEIAVCPDFGGALSNFVPQLAERARFARSFDRAPSRMTGRTRDTLRYTRFPPEADRSKPRTKSGEGEIRTRGEFPHTRFPSVRLKPLGHLSALDTGYTCALGLYLPA